MQGLVAGVLIGYFTEYATAFTYAPTKSIARAGTHSPLHFSLSASEPCPPLPELTSLPLGVTGPATVVIQGIGVGQLSTLPPVIIICITVRIVVMSISLSFWRLFPFVFSSSFSHGGGGGGDVINIIIFWNKF